MMGMLVFVSPLHGRPFFDLKMNKSTPPARTPPVRKKGYNPPDNKHSTHLSPRFLLAIASALLIGGAAVGAPAGKQLLRGHVPSVVAKLTTTGGLDPGTRLKLAIALPLRNRQELATLLDQLYDPSSPNYRRYLTRAQFTERFGPTDNDYQAVAEFAKANGFTVTAKYPNRMILDVEGAVSDIERTFHIRMRSYRHPVERRNFYAPDRDPSIDLATPVSAICGLDNYALFHSNLRKKPVAAGGMAPRNGSGSAPGGSYGGGDFRAAYLPGVTLTGNGQSVALLEYDGYYPSDIAAYERQFGLPNVPLVNVPVDGGITSPGGGNDEVSLDIEMVASMAPGLSAIYVYECPDAGIDILNQMASDDLANQISSSWGWGPNVPANMASQELVFQEMAAQGQSYFNASGDSDAVIGGFYWFPSDSPYITQVGATTLTTSGPGGSYVSETVWNWGGGIGSSGGISSYFPIPTWQQDVNMTANYGSTTMRNVPDVAMVGDDIYVCWSDGAAGGGWGGTSCAAPLWAAVTALVNQQAAAAGNPPVGFINPAVYGIGNGSGYGSAFNDVKTGNDGTATQYPGVTGYDLCTGWGSPAGQPLIDLLSIVPVITSRLHPPPGYVNQAYNYQIVATNNPASYGVAPILPPGLTLNPSTGLISGTPTAIGTTPVTISATNPNGTTSSTVDLAIVAYETSGVAQTHDSAPGISNAAFMAFGNPALNNLQHAAFQATITGSAGSGIGATNNSGIWADSGTNGLVLIAQTGAPAPAYTPGSSVGTFLKLNDPVYADSDAVAFLGTLVTTGTVSKTNNTGIWATTSGTTTGPLLLVARAGDPAPDATGTTSASSPVFASFSQIVLPDQGGVVILANLVTGTSLAPGPGGVVSTNNVGISGVDTDGLLKKVIRTGDGLTVNGSAKVISGLSIFNAPAASTGQTRHFNNPGDLIYTARFTDGSSSIVQSVFP